MLLSVLSKHRKYRFIHGYNGYVYVYIGNGKYKAEHRIVIENRINRILKFNDIVHHINGIRTDNRIENLELMIRGKHTSLHHVGKRRVEKDRVCYRCNSNRPHIRPSDNNTHVNPYAVWHHTTNDKVNWYCTSCFDWMRRHADSVPEQRRL